MEICYLTTSKKLLCLIISILVLITYVFTPIYVSAVTIDTSGKDIITSQTAPSTVMLKKPVEIDYTESGNIKTSDVNLLQKREIAMLFDSSVTMNSTYIPSSERTPFNFALYSETSLSSASKTTKVTGCTYTKGDVTLTGSDGGIVIDEILYGGTAHTEALGVNNEVTLTHTDELIDMPKSLAEAFMNDSNYKIYKYTPTSYPSTFFGPYIPYHNTLSMIRTATDWQVQGSGFFNLADEGTKTQIWYFDKNVIFYQNSGVTGKGIIIAEGDITFNGNEAVKGDILVYSKFGNVKITNATDIQGIIYAPNGNVTITGSDVKVTGSIVTKKFDTNASNLTLIKSTIGFVDEKVKKLYSETALTVAKNSSINFVNQFTDITGKGIKIHLVKYSKNANKNDFSVSYDMGIESERTALKTAINAITIDTKYANLGDAFRRSLYILNDPTIDNSIVTFTGGNVLGWTSTQNLTTPLFTDGPASYYGNLFTIDNTTNAIDYAKRTVDLIKAQKIRTYFLDLANDTSSNVISGIAEASYNSSLPLYDYYDDCDTIQEAISNSASIYERIINAPPVNPATMKVLSAYFNMTYPEGVEVTSISDNTDLILSKHPITGKYSIRGYLQKEIGELSIASNSADEIIYKLHSDQAKVNVKFNLLDGEEIIGYNKTFDLSPIYDSFGVIQSGYIEYELLYTDVNGTQTGRRIKKELPSLSINVSSGVTEGYIIAGEDSIIVGDVVQLQIKGVITGKIYTLPDIVWNSSDSKIGSIDTSGYLTGRKVGPFAASAAIDGLILHKNINVRSDIH